MNHQATTEQNKWIELSFTSTNTYDNPFKAVTLSATFTTPNHTTITVPAFWHGGNTWSVRYASDVIGTHTFTTDCNDATNLGLHQQSGEVKISAYEGDNPLYQHGAIKVAEDKRHFAHADNKPFFWLGDTWWMGLCKRLSWPEDFKTLVADRKAKGFNVIQLVAGLYPDIPAFDERGLSNSGFPWEADYSTINPAFFDEADQRIEYLVEQGLTPCILGSWGYYIQWLGVENMQRHWRYVMARWGALPVVWAASGEQTMPWYLDNPEPEEAISLYEVLKTDWTPVIKSMRDNNGFNRLITTHPWAGKSGRESVNDSALLDFDMQQTGHDKSTQLQAAAALKGWYSKPIMPVVCGESRYEALDIATPVTTKDTRQAFWAHLLNSGLAGHSYGANGIWQVNQPNQPFGDSPTGSNWGVLPWQTAMQLPGATQLGIAKQFIETLPWHALYTFLLDQDSHFIANMIRKKPNGKLSKMIQKAFPDIGLETPVAAAKTLDQQFAIFYTATLIPFNVKLNKIIGRIIAYWFDPTNGEKSMINTEAITNQPYAEFVPFGKNSAGDEDWVLVIQADPDAASQSTQAD